MFRTYSMALLGISILTNAPLISQTIKLSSTCSFEKDDFITGSGKNTGWDWKKLATSTDISDECREPAYLYALESFKRYTAQIDSRKRRACAASPNGSTCKNLTTWLDDNDGWINGLVTVYLKQAVSTDCYNAIVSVQQQQNGLLEALDVVLNAEQWLKFQTEETRKSFFSHIAAGNVNGVRLTDQQMEWLKDALAGSNQIDKRIVLDFLSEGKPTKSIDRWELLEFGIDKGNYDLVTLLSKDTHPRAIELIQNYAKFGKPYAVRERALQALKQPHFDSKESANILIAALTNQDRQIADVAKNTLIESYNSTFKSEVERLYTKASDPRVRLVAIEMLGRRGGATESDINKVNYFLDPKMDTIEPGMSRTQKEAFQKEAVASLSSMYAVYSDDGVQRSADMPFGPERDGLLKRSFRINEGTGYNRSIRHMTRLLKDNATSPELKQHIVDAFLHFFDQDKKSGYPIAIREFMTASDNFTGTTLAQNK